MSAQTGAPTASAPASQRFVDRARFRVARLENEPNPIWMRELRQAARLGRTPIVVAVLTILMSLIIAAIGGVASTETSPAHTGVILFHVFFSLAYVVVTIAGPAIAANSIASEREGRTWEAVLLTGLSPGVVARGKFLAAYTAIGMYVVALAPVGALSFLFGGVTATEVLVAFLFLFLIALLSVAFGLAISSKMDSLRGAIVVTIVLTFPLTLVAFGTFGFGLSWVAHRAWPGVLEGYPIWLPAAYERAPLNLTYAIFLFAIPVVLVTLPAWFLHEVTIANLTSITDDRSTGLKRWFVVATPLAAVACAVPTLEASGSDRGPLAVLGLAMLAAYLGFATFLFAGDPVGPSRRVLKQWDEARAGRARRFLGPGVMRSAALLLGGGLGAFALLLGLALVGLAPWSVPAPGRVAAWSETCAPAAYLALFFVFLVGLAAYLRSRTGTSLTARLLLLTILFAACVGPWLLVVLAGAFSERWGESILLAAPSPFFVIVMLKSASSVELDRAVLLGLAFGCGWALAGVALLERARRTCGAIIRRHEAMLAETDRLLAAEDEAAAAPQPVAGPEELAPAG